MAATKTLAERQKDFKERLKRLYPDYTLVNEYIDSKHKVVLKHKSGIFWEVEPRNLNGSRQAPEVNRMNRKNKKKINKITDKDFKKKFYEKYSKDEYEVLGEYKQLKINIEILHKKCGNVFKSTPANLLYHNRKGCSFCYSKTKRTVESTNLELQQKGFNDYKVTKTFSKDGHVYGNFIHSCKTCNNYEFTMRISDFMSVHSQRCPVCSLLEKESKGIKKIKNILELNSISYEQEVCFEECKDKTYLPFDIYLEDLNCIIEFDGIQHFKNTGYITEEKVLYCKAHDKIKNQFCKDYDINLLRIKYNQNIENAMTKFFKNTLNIDLKLNENG